MRITEEINELKKVSEINPELVVGMIAEAYDRHKEGKASKSDKFLLGLRYPEFFSKNDDDINGAYRRAGIYRDKIGLESFEWLMDRLREDYGLS